MQSIYAELINHLHTTEHLESVNRLLGFDYRVAMTNRDTHAPSEVSNQQIYAFFQWWLQESITPDVTRR